MHDTLTVHPIHFDVFTLIMSDAFSNPETLHYGWPLLTIYMLVKLPGLHVFMLCFLVQGDGKIQ